MEGLVHGTPAESPTSKPLATRNSLTRSKSSDFAKIEPPRSQPTDDTRDMISTSPPLPELDNIGRRGSRRLLLSKLRKKLNFSFVEAWTPSENDPSTFVYGAQYCDSDEPLSNWDGLISRSQQLVCREGVGIPGACIASGKVVVVDALLSCDFFYRTDMAEQFSFVGAIAVPVFSDNGENIVAVAVFFAIGNFKVASNMGWERLTDFLQREWRDETGGSGAPSPSLVSKKENVGSSNRTPTQAIEQVRRSLSECDLALSNELIDLLWKVGHEQQEDQAKEGGSMVANVFREWCGSQIDEQLEHWLNVHMGVVEVVRRLPVVHPEEDKLKLTETKFAKIVL